MAKFRTKARAVELLGKGQIADLPTAISELWKNGYDAYADHLSCDLYLPGFKGIESPVFTVSDDGFGMSNKDITQKWIVLGTDSKTRGDTLYTEEERLGKEPRIPMGEKGIGRLSVSYLGDQMLMLTKKKGQACQALFIDWRILDNYNLFLDDLDIPIRQINDMNDFQSDFQYLIDTFLLNLPPDTEEEKETDQISERWEEHTDLAFEISGTLKSLALPKALEKEIIAPFGQDSFHGTTFVVFSPHYELLEYRDKDRIELKQDSTTNYLRSSLTGIFNELKGKGGIQTGFWFHDFNGKYNFIDEFFSREEMMGGDHWLAGEFDDNGFFEGEVRVFNKTYKHSFRPNRVPGKTPYGPLKLEMGTFEGSEANSILSGEQWQIYRDKLERFGGFYVYRDKFRVLPYGRPDSDFLEFEERRSRSAGYYSFSHRRMIGYLEIGRKKNPGLKDKAGREGFINNKAARELKEDLIAFFIDLSLRYFRFDQGSKDPTSRQQQIEEIQKRNKRLQEIEKKRSKQTKTKFLRELNENKLELDLVNEGLKTINIKIKEESSALEINYNRLYQVISEFEKMKTELRGLRINKPRRFNLSKSQQKKYNTYQDTYELSVKEKEKIDQSILEARNRLSIENLTKDFSETNRRNRREVVSAVSRFEKRFVSATASLGENIKNDIREFELLYAEKTNHLALIGEESEAEISEMIQFLNSIASSILDSIEKKYESFVTHVENLRFDIDEDELLDWHKRQAENLEEKLNATNELAQLGMAIEIIDHQFNVLYSQMATAISFFSRFAVQNPEVEYNYRQLQSSFQHLERNHKLLTPLYRTTRRIRVAISGREIKEYLNQYFENDFQRFRVDLQTTPAFDQFEFYSYESIVKPAFINIVNNALYWLTSSSERIIRMTVEDDKILIMNSGEPIDSVYLEDIFVLFFTRKPGGRGIGLYLTRTNLRSIGYDIYATNDKKYNRLKGACFVIEKYRKENTL